MLINHDQPTDRTLLRYTTQQLRTTCDYTYVLTKKLKHIQEYVILPSTRFHDVPVRFCKNTENKISISNNDHNLGYSCYSPLLTTALTENRLHIPHDFGIRFAQQSNHHDTDTVTKPSQIRHHLIRRRETTLLRRLRHSQWLRQATQSLHKPEKEVFEKRVYMHMP